MSSVKPDIKKIYTTIKQYFLLVNFVLKKLFFSKNILIRIRIMFLVIFNKLINILKTYQF